MSTISKRTIHKLAVDVLLIAATAATITLAAVNKCNCQMIQNVVDLPITTTTTAKTETALDSGQIGLSIDLKPAYWSIEGTYVSTSDLINITAKLSDQKYNDSTTIYKWTTRDGPIAADPHAQAVTKYKFTRADEDNYVQVNVTYPKTNETGWAKFGVIVKSPVVVSDPIGKLFLEYGELLKVNLTYSGSPPFKYCYKFCSKYDIIPCSVCFPYFVTQDHVIPIVHYLHYVGNFTLVFDVSNILNREVKHYAIKINDTVRQSTLPLAPIVSSILAVCILTSGVALHIRFKDTSFNTETANFDFIRDDNEEEWEQELSFIQRVRYLFCSDDQDNEEERSYLIPKSSVSFTNGRSRY